MKIRKNPKVITASAAALILSVAGNWFLLFSGFVADAFDSQYTVLIFTLFFIFNLAGIASGILFLTSMAWVWPFNSGL